MLQAFQVIGIGTAVLAFLFAAWLYSGVKKQPSDHKRIAEVGQLIRDGAGAFMRKEYIMLAKFAGCVAVLIFIFLPTPIWTGNISLNVEMVIAYIVGTIFSGIAGVIGMRVATVANVKTAEAAAKGGIGASFLAGFRGGSVMGMAVVGAVLLGVSLLTLLIDNTAVLLGFSFGASSLALFAKAGGGIFTKTADLSADLVGKVELGIPEDDPRNPAVIADNVGDNVGDVAGMGADLFDSNVASLSAAIVLGAVLDNHYRLELGVAHYGVFRSMALCFASIGLVSSIIGVLMARIGKKGPTSALNNSTYFTTGIYIVLSAIVTYLIADFKWEIWGAGVVGLFVGTIIGIATDYFTDDT
ncbi:MAG: sodium/proton-translocating pyrophosphatase, partial [Lachnospiraceae bacterium]|nr:sodium/proton-translocating pyrophosphatase [Lachnospiraceae bacterium]